MALTVTPLPGDTYVAGNKYVQRIKVVFDSAYPTGGEAITNAQLGVSSRGTETKFTAEVTGVQAFVGHRVVWDRTDAKLLVFDEDSEVGNGVDLSTLTAICEVTTPVPPA